MTKHDRNILNEHWKTYLLQSFFFTYAFLTILTLVVRAVTRHQCTKLHQDIAALTSTEPWLTVYRCIARLNLISYYSNQ